MADPRDPLEPLFSELMSINAELTGTAARLAKVETRLAALESGPPGRPAAGPAGRAPGVPINWPTLSAAECNALWPEFVSWVIWLADAYELTTDQLPRACWFLHASLVEELTALWTSRASAYLTEEDSAASPYLWQDALHRAIERIGRAWLGSCTSGTHKLRSHKEFGTDPDYIDEVLTAGPPAGLFPGGGPTADPLAPAP